MVLVPTGRDEIVVAIRLDRGGRRGRDVLIADGHIREYEPLDVIDNRIDGLACDLNRRCQSLERVDCDAVREMRPVGAIAADKNIVAAESVE